MQGRVDIRIAQIESVTLRFWKTYEAWYRRFLGNAGATAGGNAVHNARLINDAVRTIYNYKPDAHDTGGKYTEEVMRRPDMLAALGGDCEDWNLGVVGNLLRYCSSQVDCLASFYAPSLASPRHVYFFASGTFIDLVGHTFGPQNPFPDQSQAIVWRGTHAALPQGTEFVPLSHLLEETVAQQDEGAA